MIKQFLLLLLLTALLFCTNSVASDNTDEMNVAKAVYDSEHRCFTIPDSILTNGTDVLVLPLLISLDTNLTSKKQGFEIWWHSTNCIDGSLNLIITNKQVYLKSGHENPNPNYLFWLVNITDEQYQVIEKLIKADNRLFEKPDSKYYVFRHLYYKKPKPEKEIPDEWTEKTENQFYKHCEHTKYINLRNLISFFNKGLPKDKRIPLISEEDFNRIKAVRIVSQSSEVEDMREMRKRRKKQ